MEMERKVVEMTSIQINLIWEITKMRFINRDICRERVAMVYSGSKEKLGFKEKEN